MSNLLSTTAMVAQCQTRLPIGLSTTFWMSKLNEAFRWVSQKGNFVWDIRAAAVTVNVGQNVFNFPADCDPGKPMYMAGPVSATLSTVGNLLSPIPYVQWDEALGQNTSEIIASPGGFSVWTFTTNFTLAPPPISYAYKGTMYPLSAIPTAATGDCTYSFIYHADVSGTEYAVGAGVYFPTPNSFDNLLIELAEAEAKRIYGIAGWEIIQKRAESAIVNLLDSYRSTKNVLAGLADQQKQVTEKKMMAQERA